MTNDSIETLLAESVAGLYDTTKEDWEEVSEELAMEEAIFEKTETDWDAFRETSRKLEPMVKELNQAKSKTSYATKAPSKKLSTGPDPTRASQPTESYEDRRRRERESKLRMGTLAHVYETGKVYVFNGREWIETSLPLDRGNTEVLVFHQVKDLPARQEPEPLTVRQKPKQELGATLTSPDSLPDFHFRRWLDEATPDALAAYGSGSGSILLNENQVKALDPWSPG